MQVSLHFLKLLVLLAADVVRAKPFWDYYPVDAAFSIVPSIQTHEVHTSHYHPFNLAANDLSQYVFLGESRYLNEIPGNSKSKLQANQVFFTTTETPRFKIPTRNNIKSGLNSVFPISNLFTRGGPDALPFESPVFVQDYTTALFKPTLVPFKANSTTTPSAPSAAPLTSSTPMASTITTTTVQATLDPINITDRTAPTSAPIFAALVSANSFDGTEVPPGEINGLRAQRKADSVGHNSPPSSKFFFDREALLNNQRAIQ